MSLARSSSAMPYDPDRHTGRLRRLLPEHYRGLACVHWSMTLQARATGWLEPLHHARVREALLHALARFRVVCPAYCLMPDHGHFLWMGWRGDSDQVRAAALFRGAWNLLLRPDQRALQRQPWDRVLRAAERRRGALMQAATYILDNPARAGLVATRDAWPYSGALVPGYPRLSPHAADYWEIFWRIHASLVEDSARSGSRQAFADP